MIKRVLRSILCLSFVALGLQAQSLHAQSSVGAVPAKTYTGFVDRTAVYFSAFDASSASFASANGINYAPRLSQSNRNVLPNMLFFQNGAQGQVVVLQTQPGRPDYSPLWEVISVQWVDKTQPAPLITSYADAVYYSQVGKLAAQNTGIVFNAPVVWVGMNLNRQGGQLASTIPPGEFLGINPAVHTIYFRAHPGYFGGQLVNFLALEHEPGVASFAPGVLPITTIGLNTLGQNAIANFFVVQEQAQPVLDSYPGGSATPGTGIYSIQGKAGGVPPLDTGKNQVSGVQGQNPVGGVQGQNPVGGVQGQNPVGGVQGQNPVGGVQGQNPVGGQQGQNPVGGQQGQNPVGGVQGGTLPSAGGYSPIWHVYYVSFVPGVAPRLLRSYQEIQQALTYGWITVTPGSADSTFNCPVVLGGKGTVTSPGSGGQY